jgi:hypothetical protein
LENVIEALQRESMLHRRQIEQYTSTSVTSSNRSVNSS